MPSQTREYPPSDFALPGQPSQPDDMLLGVLLIPLIIFAAFLVSRLVRRRKKP